METGIQHIVDKLEQAVLALAEGAIIKQVGVNSPSQTQPTKQSKFKTNHRCSYCTGEHLAHECTKYKTVQSRRDRVMHLRLCYNCLTPGYVSKMCHSTKTRRLCGSQHHSSLCFKMRTNSSDNTSQNANVSQGKTNQSSSSSSANQQSTKAQAQTHPNNKPVVKPNKPHTSQANVQSPTLDTTYVTNVNSSNFPNNVLLTATLNISYCNQ